MTLEEKIMVAMKDAMKSKNEASLRGLRAIKAAIIKAKTEPGAGGQVSEAVEIKLLQRLIKQRNDSLEIFTQQNRADLATKESEEIATIEQYLPQQLSEEALLQRVREIIANIGVTNPAAMGKIIGAANNALAGQADGKAIAAAVKKIMC